MLSRFFLPSSASGAADVRYAITPDPTTRLAFASCKDGQGESSQYAGRGIDFDWSVITERKPHAFVWGGDAIYGDSYRAPHRLPRWLRYVLPDVPLGSAKFKPSTPAHLRRLYTELKEEPGYAMLRSNVTAVLGTWDDHDYGVNDGDKRFVHRAASKAEFLDFLDAPPNDARRRRGPYTGIYGSTLLDGGGPNRSVLVIALDMRFSKDPYSMRHGDFLGADQWQWLERTLSASTARVHLIISSLQLLPTGREAVSECWNDFPEARDQLLRTLIKHRTRAPVVISGDVHYAELMEARCGDSGSTKTWGLSAVKYGSTLVEMTTSGLTHSWRGGSGTFGTREGAFYMTFINAVSQYVYPWRYQTRDKKITKRHYYLGENFGEVEVDWESGYLTARALRATDGSAAFERTWPMEELDMIDDGVDALKRPCVPHRGEPSLLARFSGKVLGSVLLLAILIAKPILALAIGRLLAKHVGRPGAAYLLGAAYKLKLPNALTCLRILAVPVLIFGFCTSYRWLVILVFAFSAITDWLDGYLARRWSAQSDYGAYLDPVADKLLVCVCLVFLTAELGTPVALPTSLMIGREVAVSALREWAATQGVRSIVAVGSYGKIKTAVQMIALTLLMLARPGNEGMTEEAEMMQWTGIILLYVATALSTLSLWQYASSFYRYMVERESEKVASRAARKTR